MQAQPQAISVGGNFMKTLLLIMITLISGLTNNKLFGQKHPIYVLEQKLMKGDKSALFDIAKYFDSKKEMTEFLGYHIIHTNESQVAKRIADENCIFTDSEIPVLNNLSSEAFLNFLNTNKDRVIFSKLADAFIITPLESRTSKVEFREI